MEIYTSIGEVERQPALIGYVRMLRRAWNTFDLDLVLCVNGVPTLFRTTRSKAIYGDELHELHRKFWNQGVASVLLVRDPKTVFVLSGLHPPQRIDDELDVPPLDALVQSLQHLSDSDQELLFQSIANGDFYRRYNEKFQSAGQVDQYLTDNLRDLSRLLTSDKSAAAVGDEDAHNFICRLLFTCYLVDRGIYRLPGHADQSLYRVLDRLKPVEASAYLYELFRELKRKFNGSMFDQELGVEEKRIAPHVGNIIAFLRGDRVQGMQQSLGFWAYDFRLIPIETISGIYENFLTEDDRKRKGAHYTPRFLAEMTLDVACETQTNWDTLRYLDPCCGSGVFIVTLFNRLSTAWELKNRKLEKRKDYYKLKADALLSILSKQIRGMDIKHSACALACFSLYVALLDSFDPADIDTYINKAGQKLPKIFKKSPQSTPDIPVIHQGDSLTTTRFVGELFDVVIGNPPWGGSSGRGSNDPSLRFVTRSDDLLKADGKACLLLPSKNFLNITSDIWQKEWLEGHTLERVIQLADYRFILFPSAKCPCMIVRFSVRQPDAENEVVYDTPKYDLSARRKGFVRITATDRKIIPQAQITYAAEEKDAHVLWKRWFWGTARDQRLMQYLDGFVKLDAIAGTRASKKAWKRGQGIQPDIGNKCEEPKTAWWDPGHLFVEGRTSSLNYSYFLLLEDAAPIGDRFPRLRRATDNREIFQPPHVLISQGFGKVVFCDFPVLFQDSLQAIHGPQKDESLLLFLTAYLKSSLAKYYCFHTSSKLGIERDVVRFDELLRLPFPLPADAPSERAQAIVDEVARAMRKEKVILEKSFQEYSNKERQKEWLAFRKARTDALHNHFEPLIFEYFGLLEPEQMLVHDTVHVFEPSATPTKSDRVDIPTLRPLSQASLISGYQSGLRTYADTLTNLLNFWAKERKSDWRVNAKGWINEDSGLAMIKIFIVPQEQIEAFGIITSGQKVWIWAYEQFKKRQVATQIENQLVGFLGPEFFILRPQSLVHWTRTQALNDADEFFVKYQQRRKEECNGI